ncbi:MAG: hypothetical protein Q9159_005860 [Coniocarpon cinnabarinum]
MQPSSPSKHATVSSETSSPSPTATPMQGASHAAAPPPPPPQLYQTASNASDTSYQTQPLREAVSMAFDTSNASHQISPDVVAQITQQVMNNLRMNGITSSTRAPQKPAPAPAASSMTDSTPSIPPRDVYTPPSPDREDLTRVASNQSTLVDNQMDGIGIRHRAPTRPFERGSVSKDDASSTGTRSPPTGDPTTLEKIWQPLFGDDGKPTPRLGQFLRGIALHIVEDFEPRHSLVITPQKMLKFYDAARVTEEIYPWSDMFGGKMTNSNISHLYRDLECQHHFVQRQYDEKPSIPALTPLGFQRWMTTVIQAHPDEEFMRLAKVAMDMPISNADDRKERFPKQLSRRLFPKQPEHPIRDLFEDAVLADPAIELPRHGRNSHSSQPGPAHPERPPVASAPPQPSNPPEAHMPPPPHPPQPSYLNASLDRERKPYANSAPSSEAAVEDRPPSVPHHGPPPVPIERDRKPYFAQPGGGKVYESDDGGASRSGTSSSRVRRSNTVTSKPPPMPSDYDIKERSRTRRPRSGSQSGPPPPGYLHPRRMRSPSVNAQNNPFTRSEEGMPPSSFPPGRTSNMHDDSDVEADRPILRETRDERARRRRTMDMHATYPTQPKPMFNPSEYTRQQPNDPTNGYGPPPNGYSYPPPPRYG